MIELKILGSFITASATILVALATYIWKIQREKKESNRTIIYLLLELRNVFINSVINTDRAIDGYLKLYLEKLNDQAFSPKDKSAFEAELRIALEKAFNSLIIGMKKELRVDFSSQFDSAILELSKHDPILAYRLQKNIKIEKTFEVIENHLTRTKDWVDNTNEENLPSFESISRRLESKLVEKLAGDLEQDILTVASSDSFLTKLKCKRIISNKNINSIYDFSEIGPYLDESLITVFENSSQNI